MKSEHLQALKNSGLPVRFDRSWSDCTSLGAGGPIPAVAEIENDRDLEACLQFTHRNGIPVLIVCGGTNFVGMDSPCEALVIVTKNGALRQLKVGKTHVTAGVAVPLVEVARAAAAAGLGGLAPLAGIPGRIGGAVAMNAGANGVSIGERVLQLAGYRLDGSIWTADASEIQWGYRSANLPDDVIVTAVILALPPADPAAERAAIDRELTRRHDREPAGRTAGCMFRNVSELEPAGKLIDRCGLKNLAVGAAVVSDVHANFILNRGGASASDVVELMGRIRARVAAETGFYLVPEVRFADPADRALVLASAVPPKVALLMGGTSSEREISLRSGAAVGRALTNAGFEVVSIDLKNCAVTPEMRGCDVVYPVLHGGFGEDGRIQAALEQAGLPFVGSGSAACRLVMDKIATKRQLDAAGLPTAPWAIVRRAAPAFPENLQYPVVVKVPNEGSTVGVVKVEGPEEWNKALDGEFALADELLVEAFLPGSELTVPVLRGHALPVVEIHPPHGFYDWDAKYVYNQGHTRYECPPDTLSPELQREAAELAERFTAVTGSRDILRVDLMCGGDGKLYILEGNSIPGCTATSLVPKSARAAGISFERMTSDLVRAALARKGA